MPLRDLKLTYLGTETNFAESRANRSLGEDGGMGMGRFPKS